jgi:hypothetical protein
VVDPRPVEPASSDAILPYVGKTVLLQSGLTGQNLRIKTSREVDALGSSGLARPPHAATLVPPPATAPTSLTATGSTARFQIVASVSNTIKLKSVHHESTYLALLPEGMAAREGLPHRRRAPAP